MDVGALSPATLAAYKGAATEDPAQKALRVSSIFDAMAQDDPSARASALVSLVEQANRDREPFHQIWTESDGMCFGDQWGAYNIANRTWSPRAPAPSNKIVRLELNHIHGLVQTAVALHCAETQSWGVAARTSELSDTEAAKVGADLVDYYQSELQHEEMRQFQAAACIVTGTCYVMPFWDSAAGRITSRQQMTAAPVFSAANEMTVEPQFSLVSQAEGDLRMRFFSDYQVTVETGSTPTNPPMWMATQEMVPLAELLAHPAIPDATKSKLSVETPFSHTALRYEAARQAMSPRSGYASEIGGYSAQFGFQREGVCVTRIFVRATPRFPLGREYLCAGGALLWEDDNPRYPKLNEIGEKWPAWPFPIFVFRNYAVTGSWYGQGDVVRMIGPQKTMNGSISKEVVYVRRLSNSILVKPKGVNFQPSDEVDQVMEVPSSVLPGQVHYLNQPSAPMQLTNMEQRMYAVMQRQIGIDDATLGSMPSANAPASAVEKLKQSSIGRRRPIENRWSRTWADCYAYGLFLLRRHVVEERILQIVGLNRRTSTLAFSRAKLASGMDIKVYEDFARPRDPAQRAVWAQTLIGLGLVDPKNPDERAEMQKMMGAGGMVRFSDRLTRHREKAERENFQMYHGQMPTVAYHEDDNEHLAGHYGEMDSEEFELKTRPSPEDTPEITQQKFKVKSAFEQHCRMHLQQQAQKQMAMAASMTPPAAGAGGPPAGQAPPSTAPAEEPMGAAA